MDQRPFNNSISVDCVIFGFDGKTLKVLLVERHDVNGESLHDYKLPGSLIYEDEDIATSANRVMEQMTELRNVYLKQLSVFSDPKRVDAEELNWLNKYYGVKTSRVVTVAYYALLKLDDKIIYHTRRKNARWFDVHEIKRLALDHKQIIVEALSMLENEIVQLPIVSELLPKKFTCRQLQNLYEAVWGEEIDNRNFRKKVLSSGYIFPTGDKESGVAHKPAIYYRFDNSAYNKIVKKRGKLKGL